MKKLFFILCMLPFLSFAQKTYTVGAKETLFSIGRKLNIHPRELAEYNKISFETGVKAGQVLNIPAVKKMAPLPEEVKKDSSSKQPLAVKPTEAPKQTTPAAPVKNSTSVGADMEPVYHKVEKKETLFQISQKSNVSIDEIKKWNKLSADGVNEGASLIVGYKKKENKTEIKKQEPPVVSNTPAEKLTTTTAVVPEVKTSSGVVRDFGGGFFRTFYNSQISGNAPASNENGLAAVFKSTSGWTDGKYYCLHNAASAGTIIKITNKKNQKFVYAKVLDVIPDLKQNEGLIVRLSNAAADELGSSSDVFDVQLTY